MKKSLVLLAMFSIVLALGLVLVGCDNGSTTHETVATPTATPAAGTYATTQTVTLASATAGADIYYTTDGTTTPTASSTQYTAPFAVSMGTTLKAIAVKTGMTDSVVLTAAYTQAINTLTITGLTVSALEATGATNAQATTWLAGDWYICLSETLTAGDITIAGQGTISGGDSLTVNLYTLSDDSAWTGTGSYYVWAMNPALYEYIFESGSTTGILGVVSVSAESITTTATTIPFTCTNPADSGDTFQPIS
jgi:LysM repeat protein